MNATVQIAVNCRNILGESPVWDWRDQCLWWVDLRYPTLWRHTPSTSETKWWPMPALLGSVVLRRKGGVILGMSDGFYGFDPLTKRLELIFRREEPEAGHRINDCKVDRDGNLWWSTMWDFGKQRTGRLYRLTPDFRNEVVLGNLWVPNALAFYANGKTGVFADSKRGQIEFFDTQPSLPATNWRVLDVSETLLGVPDGATVDAEDGLWVARFDGSSVVRFGETGTPPECLALSAARPTSCAFGGADLKTLFITTATQGLDLDSQSPHDGALLAVELDTKGLKEQLFDG